LQSVRPPGLQEESERIEDGDNAFEPQVDFTLLELIYRRQTDASQGSQVALGQAIVLPTSDGLIDDRTPVNWQRGHVSTLSALSAMMSR
jgi:hypothetical protein